MKVFIMNELRVPAGEFNRKPGYYQDQAKSSPVVITRNGREQVVLIDVAFYKRLLQSYRHVMPIAELPERYVELLVKSSMSES